MNKNTLIGQKVKRIISKINSMDKKELMTRFIQLNYNSRKEFQEIFHKSCKINDFEQRYNLISPLIEKLLLKKKEPISSMLPYFKNMYKIIEGFDLDLITKKIEIDMIIPIHYILKKMIKTLIMGIEKKDETIITVDYSNTKDSLKKEFDKMLTDELPQSPTYNERKKLKEQNEEKLRTYLKVWELKKLGLEFEDIALFIYKNKAQKTTVQKQFYTLFEIILGCKYDKEKYKQYILQDPNRKLCTECQKKESCKEPCQYLIEELESIEVKQKEKIGANPIG